MKVIQFRTWIHRESILQHALDANNTSIFVPVRLAHEDRSNQLPALFCSQSISPNCKTSQVSWGIFTPMEKFYLAGEDSKHCALCLLRLPVSQECQNTLGISKQNNSSDSARSCNRFWCSSQTPSTTHSTNRQCSSMLLKVIHKIQTTLAL